MLINSQGDSDVELRGTMYMHWGVMFRYRAKETMVLMLFSSFSFQHCHKHMYSAN